MEGENMLREIAINSCTVNRFWVCMIEGRVLTSRRGVCAWRNKCGAARTFIESGYWLEKVAQLKKEIAPDVKWGDFDLEEPYVKLKRQKYEQLLKDGIVKYIEVSPVPEKCC